VNSSAFEEPKGEKAMPKRILKSTNAPKYLRWNDRERHIIDKSIEYFSQHGFDVSTRDIAAYIGITQSLLYRYFSSKQALVERIYKEVFVLRWKPEWETMIRDRSRPLRQRLVIYLIDYCDYVLDKDWVRLFLFGALAGTSINRRFFPRLHEGIFTAILDELYHDNEISLPRNALDRKLDLEVVWGFHASFFYIGVRRWVYHLPVPDDLQPVIRSRVSAFLDGVGSEFAERNPTTSRPTVNLSNRGVDVSPGLDLNFQSLVFLERTSESGPPQPEVLWPHIEVVSRIFRTFDQATASVCMTCG